MSIITNLFILASIYTVVQSEIPNLNVRKLDRNLIAKKRQDTLDMCRIFTEENNKIQKTKPKIISSYKHVRRNLNTRNKRAINRNKADFLENQATRTSPQRHKREIDVNRLYAQKAFDIHKQEKKSGTYKYSVNPALNRTDLLKIESIVQNMYDDMEEKGQKIAFRRNPDVTEASITTTAMKPNNKSEKSPSRRLYFAPKLLTAVQENVSRDPPNETSVYEKARWKHGIIPYFIDSKTYDAHLQNVITDAFDYIEKATCIRLQKLRERPTDEKSLQDVDWVYITNPSGVRQCVHSNEKRKINGVQMSVLGYDCMTLGDIVHEMMHILGFSHEHTRPDRDQHISILWDNIKPGYKKYFEISKMSDQYTLEHLPYDYASILHYPPRAFSKNGQVTIKTEPGIKIGQREALSEIDLEKVGSIYASECVERNKEYLLKTCPSVVKSEVEPAKVSQKDIEEYFKERLWPFGIVNYKLRDEMEFSTEERENIKAVIDHIEKETCIQFHDISATNDEQHEEEYEQDEYSNKIEDEETIDHNDPYANPPEIITILPHDEDITRNGTENEMHTDDQKQGAGNTKRVRRQAKPPQKSLRRHANSIMILTRSPLPGCKCPKPGKPSGNTVLEINADCFNSVNDLLHLFVHVLGLDHQHNMHDRDQYLHIVWENLTPDIKEELKNTLPPAASVGFPYDYQSVMHYPWLQIKNGVTSMMYPIWNDGWAMGHWQGLSSFDVQKLNLLYFSQCSERQRQSYQ